MAIAWKQGLSVASYIFSQRLKGVEKYPLVLMLEPLFRCNLECAGCGKIQYPEDILKKRLSAQECEDAAMECGAPVVSIAGGEPLIHPEMPEIAERLAKRKKFIYLCTNAILLTRELKKYKPNPYFRFSVHLDGLEETHDKAVCRKGVFKQAVEGIKAAKAAGFTVSTNTTIYLGADPNEFRRMFDFVTELGVDGMMISPGYPYEKAPDQEHFLQKEQTRRLFRQILDHADPKWRFNHSNFFLEFLQGDRDYQCTAWGNPTRNVFGWQKPCYLMSDGYVKSFRELIDQTPWERYGAGKDPRCADCMVHCGYEATAVNDATSSLKNMLHALQPVGRGRNGNGAGTVSIAKSPATVPLSATEPGYPPAGGWAKEVPGARQGERPPAETARPNVKMAFQEKERS